MVKAKGIDAFEGVDVKDKIVVLYSSKFANSVAPPRPDGVTAEDVKGEKGVDWADPQTYAKMKGAKGVIVIASPQLEGFWARLSGFLGRGGMSIEGLGNDNEADGDDDFPVLLANKDVAKVMFEGEEADHTSAKAFALKKSGNMTAAGKIEKIPTQNVVALWEGSDPKLKEEMVAVGAHYDHVGTNENAPGEDKIWNGADDDGSGTVAVLAIAEALAKAKKRPKRSVLLVWHAGEEKGLLGASYFNKYPTVNIKNVVTQLNIDMIGRSKKEGDTNPKNKDLSGPDSIYVIGSEMMSSTLGAITKGTNNSFLKMDYDYKYDDPKDTNRFFFRSDHFMYAQNGIPIVFWFDGVHEDYHQPTDHPDKIDYQKMEKVTRTIFLTMWELTELKERPVVDKELPKELRSRN
jgi:Zn-dependent M28 family amino/carboxypeptidase